MTHDPVETYVRHVTNAQRPLYNFILTLVPNLNDADDVLGETNSVLWRKRDDFNPTQGEGPSGPSPDPHTQFLRFARTVARFQALAFLKKHQRDQLRFDDSLLGTLADESASRAGAFEAKRHALAHCTAKLSDKDRDLLHRRYQSGQRADAIAQDVGRSPNAIYQALHRIRQSLLVCIESRIGDNDNAPAPGRTPGHDDGGDR